MKKDFKPGDIIEWDKHQYRVLENYGESGRVQHAEPEGAIIEDFKWFFCGTESILVASKEIEVTKCEECPFYNDGRSYNMMTCDLEKEEEGLKKRFTNGEIIQEWCPLKSGPVIVSLKV